MRSLFIDTSNSDVSIGLLENGKLKKEVIRNTFNEHSKYAVSIIDEVISEDGLSPSDIDEILVVNGPGSFTGIRIGLTISKVYAYLNNIKVILVSSLKCLALSYCDSYDYILSVIDAKRSNYYVGLYDKNYNEVVMECFCNKDYIDNILLEYSNVCIVSNSKIEFNSFVIEKLNIEKIYNYYKDSKRVSANMVLPNYLKLPQVLEKDDKRSS